MTILSIETSCDETALALLDVNGGLKSPKIKIIKSLVASQIKLHAKYGGVVPGLAKREHIKNLPILMRKIFGNPKSEIRNPKQYGIRNTVYDIRDVDLIAVTVGPGLEPALWTGIEFAKQIHADLRRFEHGSARSKKVELAGANHLHGHLYSFLLSKRTGNPKSLPARASQWQAGKILNPKQIQNTKYQIPNVEDLFPAVALIVSGGHTILALMENLKEYKKLGETMDDAVGESFDKVARLLGLPYPGGPALEKLAKKGNPDAIPFPSPMLNQNNYNFSYSGLKTAVLYHLRGYNTNFPLRSKLRADEARIYTDVTNANPWSPKNICNHSGHSNVFVDSHRVADIAASFQRAAFLPLVIKTARAAKEFKAKSIVIGGGVAANKELARMLKLKVKSENLKVNLFVPPIKYCMDNAVMIAVAAYINKLRNKKYSLEADGNLNL